MGKFYTGKGDKGISYVGKKKIKKSNPFVEVLGQFDELNSMIGIVKSLPAIALAKESSKSSKGLREVLHEVQEALFVIQANLAYRMLKEKRTPPALREGRIKDIEEIIDNVEKKLGSVDKFIISGANHMSAWFDFLRARSRNVERSIHKVKELHDLSPEIKAYLNRLSSLFFALARWEARKHKEKNPKYK